MACLKQFFLLLCFVSPFLCQGQKHRGNIDQTYERRITWAWGGSTNWVNIDPDSYIKMDFKTRILTNRVNGEVYEFEMLEFPDPYMDEGYKINPITLKNLEDGSIVDFKIIKSPKGKKILSFYYRKGKKTKESYKFRNVRYIEW